MMFLRETIHMNRIIKSTLKFTSISIRSFLKEVEKEEELRKELLLYFSDVGSHNTQCHQYQLEYPFTNLIISRHIRLGSLSYIILIIKGVITVLKAHRSGFLKEYVDFC